MLDASVVAEIATRDGVPPEQARARAIDTLRLVAAARAEQVERGEEPGLRPRRAEHLRRAARARLWLRERFEAEHGAAQIPDDDPLLVRARADPRLVHPEIWGVCQVVIEPPHVEALAAKAEITADPQWQAAASAALEPVAARILRNVPADDREACKLIAQQVALSDPPADPRLSLTYPRAGGFDLDACREPDDAGACAKPQFDPQWTAKVRTMEPQSFSAPFFTPFGLHLVYVENRLPAQPADDPRTELALREHVLDAWRAEQLDRSLQAMGEARAVRMVRPTEDAR